MTIHFFSTNTFQARNLFRQILCLLLLFSLVSLSTAQAEVEPSDAFAAEFSVLTEDNLPHYVSRMAQRYYEQVELLGKYFQLYQQRRDPRGFNVWHLKGFSPNFNTLNAQIQQVAMLNEAFLAERPEKALSSIFAGLKDVSVNLMVAFRDNDPQAFKLAKTQVQSHSAQLESLLKAHNLNHEVRQVSLD